MKDDVQSQIAQVSLQAKGFFVIPNVYFGIDEGSAFYEGESDDDDYWSYVDIVAVNPNRRGPDRVVLVSIDQSRSGFDPVARLRELHEGRTNRPFWRRRRELWSPEWGQSLLDVVEGLTGQRSFRYYIETRHTRNRDHDSWHGWEWRESPAIHKGLEGVWVGFVRVEDVFRELLELNWSKHLAWTNEFVYGLLLGSEGLHELDMLHQMEVDEPFTQHPFSKELVGPSVAAMYDPPPVVADVWRAAEYANGVEGYEFAAGEYGIEPDPVSLQRVVEQFVRDRPTYERWASRNDVSAETYPPVGGFEPFDLSFEQARLVQFYEARSWHFGGGPQSRREEEQHLALHAAICLAWAERRFDHQRPWCKDNDADN